LFAKITSVNRIPTAKPISAPRMPPMAAMDCDDSASPQQIEERELEAGGRN